MIMPQQKFHLNNVFFHLDVSHHFGNTELLIKPVHPTNKNLHMHLLL